MRPPRTAEPPIATFRVRLIDDWAGEAWREIEVAANQRLVELGDAIPLAFGIERGGPWRFLLPGAAGPVELCSPAAQGGLRAARFAVSDLPLPGVAGRREFGFLLEGAQPWRFGVKLVRAAPMAEARAAYPRIVAMHGWPPEEALVPLASELPLIPAAVGAESVGPAGA